MFKEYAANVRVLNPITRHGMVISRPYLSIYDIIVINIDQDEFEVYNVRASFIYNSEKMSSALAPNIKIIESISIRYGRNKLSSKSYIIRQPEFTFEIRSNKMGKVRYSTYII